MNPPISQVQHKHLPLLELVAFWKFEQLIKTQGLSETAYRGQSAKEADPSGVQVGAECR